MLTYEEAVDELSAQHAARKYNLYMGGAHDRVAIEDTVVALNTIYKTELTLWEFSHTVEHKFNQMIEAKNSLQS